MLLKLRINDGLASAYMAQSDIVQAIPRFEQTLAARIRMLGQDHPDTLTSRNNLALAYQRTADLARAIPLYEQTLADSIRVLGDDHPSTLTSRNNLAAAYQAAGRPDQAIPLFERTLADRERVLGDTHPATLTSRNNLATAYQAAGRPDQAIPLFERTLADRERVLGDTHPATLTSRNNLATAYQAAGRTAEAIPLFERTLADRERVLGDTHPDTLTSRNNLATTYQAAGRTAEAIPLVPGEQESHAIQEAAARRDVMVAGRDHVIVIGSAGVADPAVPSFLPRDVPGFTGRESELDLLMRLAGTGRAVVIAIGGTAGVGKTALAVHAAHRLLPEFPDGYLYADLRGYTEGQDLAEPGEVLEVFLRRLGVPADEVPATVEERSGLLRQLLASRRILMVLDNARTEAQVRPMLPGAGESMVLVTSRSLLPGLEADERINLDVLTADEAVAMLAGLAGAARAADEAAVAEVARLCGRLPLALRIAGQLLAAHPAWPVARLVQMLGGEQDRLAQLGAGDLQVRAAFEISYRQLAEEDARLFRLLGLHPGPDFDVPAAAALADTEDEAAEPTLDRLAETYLVTEDTAGRFRMHDLLRLFARDTCQQTDTPADRDAAQARLVGHYVDLARFLDACLDLRLRPATAQAAAQAGRSLPSPRQALAIFETERPNLLAILGLAAQRGWDEQVERLSESMGDSLARLRDLDDLLTVRQAALAAALHAANTAAEGRALGNLGIAYRELRRFEEAITSFQQSLAVMRETGDRHGEGMALTNLGIAYRELRRFEEAITSFQQSLAVMRETGDRHGEGQALTNLGIAYRELRRFEEAITSFQQSLAIFYETGDRHGEGQTLTNLGIAYRELRRFEEAITSFQQSLAIFYETGDRHGEGMALGNLGIAYRELRRFEEAITSFQQSLAVMRETGDRHGEGQTLANLGNAYHDMRWPDRAAACWRDAAAAMRDAGDHEAAARLEQQAASAGSRRRRWWRGS